MALEEELRLNIDGALGEVDRLGAALTQTAQQFSADLASALDPLQSVTVAVPVTADTTDLPSEVEAAAAAANPTVAVAVDAGDVSTEVEAAVAGAAPPPIPITADTSEATAAVDDLSASASGALDNIGSTAQSALSGIASTATAAGSNVTSVGGAMGSFGDVTNTATGAVQGLTSSVGGELDPALGALIGTIGGVAAAFGTIGAITDFFVGKATESVSAAQRFDQQFGTLAGNVERFQDLNLGGTLGEVTTQLGSGVTAIRNADSNFAALGNSVGASREQIALTAQQLNALATRAVALNPSLGSVGDVVDQLQARIGRGGRFVSQFGLSLNKTEIDARAASIALQRGSDVVEQYDRTVAATQLSVEKLGNRLNTDIATGAQNVTFTFKELQLEVNKAFTEFGKPLIAPALDVLRAFTPIAVSVGKELATLARATLPLIEAAFKAVGPLIEQFANALEEQLPVVLPAINDLAQTLVDTFGKRMKPVVDELVKELPFMASAFADITVATARLLDYFGPLIEGLGQVTSLLMLLTPQGMISTFDQLVNGSDKAAKSTTNYADKLKEAAAAERARAQSQSQLQASFDGLNAQVEKLGTVSSLSLSQVNFLGLGIGNLRGKSDVELTAIAARLGVNAEAFKTWRDAVVQRIAELVNEVQGKLPSVASIINGLGDNVSPQGLLQGLQTSTTAVENFQKNIETIRQQAGPNVDALIAEILKLGPIVGGKLAQQIANGGPYLAKSLADQYAALRAANDRLLTYVRDEFGPQFVVSTGGAAQEAADAFGVGLGTMAPEARRQAALASIALLQGFSNIAQTLGVLAPELGAQLSAGIALGVSANLRVVVDSTNEMIQASIAAANAAAGVRSPSTVFATIGGYMVDGLALGLGEQKVAVDAASSLVANVAGAARAQANLSPARLPAGSRIVRFEDGSLGVIRVDASGREFNDVAAARLLTADTERLRAAVNGRLAAPSGVPPLLQTMFGMTATGAPTSTVSGAVTLWGEQVGNQILRSLANGRLGLTPDQFAGASVKAADVNIGGQRLGALPGNAPVVVNVTAPAGTDPTIAREFGKVVGNEVRSAVVSLRAQVVAS